jgi:hypothetical protein
MFNQACRFIGYRGIGVEVTAGTIARGRPRPLNRPVMQGKCGHFPPSPSQNHLLAALPAAEFEPPHIWSWSRCRSATCSTNPAASCGTPISHHAIVSLHYVMEIRRIGRTAGVGNEGVVGISLFMGGNTTPSSAVVQTAGHAYRLDRRVAEGGVFSRRPPCSACCCATPRP